MEQDDSMKFGKVVGCERLNVRAEPNIDSEVICVISQGTEIMLDNENSSEEFFKVYTPAGLEGFCMKDFISVLDC